MILTIKNLEIVSLILLIFSVGGLLKGFQESKAGNSYGNTKIFNLLGAFVWGDLVIFGVFWTFVAITNLIIKDWILFLLIISVFWLVRSFGEMIYWFNQQFSKIERMPPEKLWFYKYFKNDSVWFIYQIYWQCALVITIITTIYLTSAWVK